MPHNFRLTGSHYLAKSGSDANAGTDPNAPKLTLQAALNALSGTKELVVGSGVYKETISFPGNANFGKIKVDGLVVFEGNGNDTFNIGALDSFIIEGNSLLIIRNYSLINVNGAVLYLNGTTVKVPFNSSQIRSLFLSNCKLINSITNNPAFDVNLRITVDRCIFIGSTLNEIQRLTNSDVDSSSAISMHSTLPTADFNYNNIRGTIKMKSGSQNGVALSFADHRTAYPTYNVNSFSADPKYNDLSKEDFTYQPDSPNIRTAVTGNIGNVELSRSFYCGSSPELLASGGASLTNLTGTNDLEVNTSGGTTGILVTAPIYIADYLPELGPVNYVGALTFNKSSAGPSTSNKNVPDWSRYPAGHTTGGDKPDRLGYQMRWSTQATKPTTDAEWDNQGYVTAGQYSHFEWNQNPELDINRVGNGDPAFDHTNKFRISGRWVQVRITLRNDY